MNEDRNPNSELETICSYSRARALKDGVLVDVTDLAKEVGFTMPVALTQAAYGNYVTVPESVSCQDEDGRLWDILWMLRHAINTSDGATHFLGFELMVRNSDKQPAKTVRLRALCGPGDTMEPVLTVMMPGED